MIVNDVEQADAASVFQAVMHEVHAPGDVGLGWHGQWLGLFSGQPLSRLDAQMELQLAIHPVNPLVVPTKALDVAQKQEAQAKAPGAVVVGQA